MPVHLSGPVPFFHLLSQLVEQFGQLIVEADSFDEVRFNFAILLMGGIQRLQRPFTSLDRRVDLSSFEEIIITLLMWPDSAFCPRNA